MDERKRYCKNCGAEIIPDSNYYPRCGIGVDYMPLRANQPQKTSRKGLSRTMTSVYRRPVWSQHLHRLQSLVDSGLHH